MEFHLEALCVMMPGSSCCPQIGLETGFTDAKQVFCAWRRDKREYGGYAREQGASGPVLIFSGMKGYEKKIKIGRYGLAWQRMPSR